MTIELSVFYKCFNTSQECARIRYSLTLSNQKPSEQPYVNITLGETNSSGNYEAWQTLESSFQLPQSAIKVGF